MGHQLRFRSPGAPRAELAAELTKLGRIDPGMVRARTKSGAQNSSVVARAAWFDAFAVPPRTCIDSCAAALRLDWSRVAQVAAALAAPRARIGACQSSTRFAAVRGTAAVARTARLSASRFANAV